MHLFLIKKEKKKTSYVIPTMKSYIRKWIDKRSRFHVSKIILPQAVLIFAKSHLYRNIYAIMMKSLDRSVIKASYQLGYINWTF